MNLFRQPEPSTTSGPESDEESGRLLRRNRTLATGLLLVMASLFVGLHFVPDPGFWIRLLQALTEAAVVGALADWFAVTALFRRPLGLPIPHTAIIPRNKDRIGEGLGRFVERNFLDPDLVAAKLRSIDPAARLARWLSVPGNAEGAADRIAASVPGIIRSIEDRELRQFFVRTQGERLRALEVAPLLGRMLDLLLERGHHQVLIERMVAAALDYVERNETRLEELVGEKSGWWMPRSIDRRVARAVGHGARELLADLLDPASHARIRLEMAVEQIATDLRTDPEMRAKVEAAKQQLLDQPEVLAWLGRLWDEARDAALSDLAAPGGRTRGAIVSTLRSIGMKLAADEAMRLRVNVAAERFAMRIVVPWREGIGHFISEVVRSWDTRTVTRRLEMAVGSDLQYVRISGTLVAALVGTGLFLVRTALG
jgi:uncharacterized membrane-anchored protein YjiN (DUF445 family)